MARKRSCVFAALALIATLAMAGGGEGNIEEREDEEDDDDERANEKANQRAKKKEKKNVDFVKEKEETPPAFAPPFPFPSSCSVPPFLV